MKQKIVGVFSIGFEDCQLVLREGTGGEFYNCPGVGECPRIKIGADIKDWKDVVAVVMHEALELEMNRLRCRYDCSYDMAQDHARYLFVATHPQFSDAVARASYFIAECHNSLQASWISWHRAASKKAGGGK